MPPNMAQCNTNDNHHLGTHQNNGNTYKRKRLKISLADNKQNTRNSKLLKSNEKRSLANKKYKYPIPWKQNFDYFFTTSFHTQSFLDHRRGSN